MNSYLKGAPCLVKVDLLERMTTISRFGKTD